jgi:hypothetical protein
VGLKVNWNYDTPGKDRKKNPEARRNGAKIIDTMGATNGHMDDYSSSSSTSPGLKELITPNQKANKAPSHSTGPLIIQDLALPGTIPSFYQRG